MEYDSRTDQSGPVDLSTALAKFAELFESFASNVDVWRDALVPTIENQWYEYFGLDSPSFEREIEITRLRVLEGHLKILTLLMETKLGRQLEEANSDPCNIREDAAGFRVKAELKLLNMLDRIRHLKQKLGLEASSPEIRAFEIPEGYTPGTFTGQLSQGYREFSAQPESIRPEVIQHEPSEVRQPVATYQSTGHGDPTAPHQHHSPQESPAAGLRHTEQTEATGNSEGTMLDSEEKTSKSKDGLSLNELVERTKKLRKSYVTDADLKVRTSKGMIPLSLYYYRIRDDSGGDQKLLDLERFVQIHSIALNGTKKAVSGMEETADDTKRHMIIRRLQDYLKNLFRNIREVIEPHGDRLMPFVGDLVDRDLLLMFEAKVNYYEWLNIDDVTDFLNLFEAKIEHPLKEFFTDPKLKRLYLESIITQ